MSPRVSRSLLNILIDISNAVFWMVSTCPPFPNLPVPLPVHSGLLQAQQLLLVSPYYYYYYYHIPFFEFFISSLADGFSLEFE